MKINTSKFVKGILLAVAVLTIGSAHAQLQVNGSQPLTQMVQSLFLGSGVTISNVTYIGASQASGTFNDTSLSTGFGGGVLLTTGSIQNAVGPNNNSAISIDNQLLGDADLDLIMSPYSSYDASALEFDFVPAGDTVLFRYAFASDEYMEYANGGINDGFGFFVSGPGISGPYSNNSINIALLPGTTIPVTINNVNLVNNSMYYHDNGNGTGTGTAPDGFMIQYDGYTLPLTAMAVLSCGQTYHIKIAIADGSDHILDSGVFLEGYSFSSLVSAPSNLRASNHYCPQDSSYLIVAPPGFANYQWFDGNNNMIHASQGGTNDSLFIQNPTFGQVYRLVMSPPLSCGSVLRDTIVLSATNYCIQVGIAKEIKHEGFNISPNPFTSQTTLTFSTEQKSTEVRITDVLGKEIKSLHFSGKELIIEKGEMENGIYFVEITDVNKNRENRKIVVE